MLGLLFLLYSPTFKDGEVKSWLRLAQKEIYLVSLQKQNKEGYCIFFFFPFAGKRQMNEGEILDSGAI